MNFFRHDEFNSDVAYFETLEEALKDADNVIKECGSDGWPQEILDGAIKVGIVLHESSKSNERDTDNPEWDFECDCEMVATENEVESAKDAEITRLKSANKVLREMGEKYADKENWRRSNQFSNIVAPFEDVEMLPPNFTLRTGGLWARAALKREKQIMEGLTEAGEKV